MHVQALDKFKLSHANAQQIGQVNGKGHFPEYAVTTLGRVVTGNHSSLVAILVELCSFNVQPCKFRKGEISHGPRCDCAICTKAVSVQQVMRLELRILQGQRPTLKEGYR